MGGGDTSNLPGPIRHRARISTYLKYALFAFVCSAFGGISGWYIRSNWYNVTSGNQPVAGVSMMQKIMKVFGWGGPKRYTRKTLFSGKSHFNYEDTLIGDCDFVNNKSIEYGNAAARNNVVDYNNFMEIVVNQDGLGYMTCTSISNTSGKYVVVAEGQELVIYCCSKQGWRKIMIGEM